MASPLVHTRVKRIHEDLDTCIGLKKKQLAEEYGVSRINYYDASKKIAEDYRRYKEEIQLVKKNFPLYKRLKDL